MKIWNVILLLCVTSCTPPKLLKMQWIDDSNATPMQKQALRDGCMYAYAGRFRSTIIRDQGGTVINPYYSSDGTYRSSWREALYSCHIMSGSLDGGYTRDWNVIGFKGDSIAYK